MHPFVVLVFGPALLELLHLLETLAPVASVGVTERQREVFLVTPSVEDPLVPLVGLVVVDAGHGDVYYRLVSTIECEQINFCAVTNDVRCQGKSDHLLASMQCYETGAHSTLFCW